MGTYDFAEMENELLEFLGKIIGGMTHSRRRVFKARIIPSINIDMKEFIQEHRN